MIAGLIGVIMFIKSLPSCVQAKVMRMIESQQNDPKDLYAYNLDSLSNENSATPRTSEQFS